MDLQVAAERLAEEIGPKIAAQAPATGTYRLAVFPFGDADGKMTPDLGLNPQIIQAALEEQLRVHLAKAAPGKFSVLTRDGLQASFKTLSLDPAGISYNHLDTTKTILQRRIYKSEWWANSTYVV